MRIDQLLNKLCLVKSRSIIKKACDMELVTINSKIAKASNIVQENDVIVYKLHSYVTEVKILSIPKNNVSKKNAVTFYEILKREKLEV